MNPFVTLPNFLSFLRIPLALLLWNAHPFVRLAVVGVAALTDFLDGWLARRSGRATSFGASLDPAADKFFVYMALFIFFIEHRLTGIELLTFFFRDLSVFLCWLWVRLNASTVRLTIRSIWCGKITTTLQFAILAALALSCPVPAIAYLTMAGFGILSLPELLFWQLTCQKSQKRESPKQKPQELG